MTARTVIATKVFYNNGLQHLQTVAQTSSDSFELVGHSLELGCTFVEDLTLWEYLQWAGACPEQVTLIPA
jgi:hypothetical protein